MNTVISLSMITFILPFTGFIFIGVLAKKIKHITPYIATSLLFLSFLASTFILILIIRKNVPSVITFTWLKSDTFVLDFGLRIDALASIMLVVVTLVSFLVHLFSMDYMQGDPGIARYYAELQLFTASMIGVVTAINLLQLFMFWELVGLCSYLLIGFWFFKRSAYQAAKKAFFVTKVGDCGFIIAIILIFLRSNPHTLNLVSLQETWVLSALPVMIATATGILLFCGVMGKSAQFPLHIWLPNAMEGPTPVSALIHAATMVAAGIYLAARTLFLFSPTALFIVMFIGSFTAFFAATIATVQSDIKKVLAYSTISQLGYMVLALGSAKAGKESIVSPGAIAGLFHLVTHAIFKGLLFLGSGSVIHATHTQDMRDMGGLFKKLPITGATFIIGSLALAGIFPLAGFFSKDAILSSVLVSAEMQPITWIPFSLAIITAFLTPLYMTRCVWLTFFGVPRKENHAHEATIKTTLPLIILAILSVFVGLTGSILFGNPLQKMLMGAFYETEKLNWSIMLGSTIIALFAILLGYLMYGVNRFDRNQIKINYFRIYQFLQNKWYIDEIWTFLAVKPLFILSTVANWTDKKVIDGFVNDTSSFSQHFSLFLSKFDLQVIDQFVDKVGILQIKISHLSKWIDNHIVDKAVTGTAYYFGWAGARIRKIQTGYVPNYSLVMFFSLFIILIAVALVLRL